MLDATWFVLVPHPAGELEAWVHEFRMEHAHEGTPTWELADTAAGRAVVDREPGSEGAYDLDLAAALSRLAGEVALVWPQTDGLLEFEDGHQRTRTRRSLWDWLDEHQIAPPRPLEPITRSELVVLGAGRDDLQAIFPAGGPIDLEDGPAGAIVRHRTDDAGVLGPMLSAQIDADVICVTRIPGEGLSVDLLRSGEVVGRYGVATIANRDAPVLEEVLGERSDQAILAALSLGGHTEDKE